LKQWERKENGDEITINKREVINKKNKKEGRRSTEN
jgi:hypothetical protein